VLQSDYKVVHADDHVVDLEPDSFAAHWNRVHGEVRVTADVNPFSLFDRDETGKPENLDISGTGLTQHAVLTRWREENADTSIPAADFAWRMPDATEDAADAADEDAADEDAADEDAADEDAADGDTI